MIWSSTDRKAWFGHSEHLVFGLPQRPRTHSFPQAGEYPDLPDLAFSHRRGKTSGRPRKRSLKRRTFSADLRTEVAIDARLASRCIATVSVRDWRKDSTFARASTRARVRRSSSASASSIALAKRSCWSVLPKPRDRTRRPLPAVLPCGEESHKGRQPYSFVCSHQRRQHGLVHVSPHVPRDLLRCDRRAVLFWAGILAWRDAAAAAMGTRRIRHGTSRTQERKQLGATCREIRVAERSSSRGQAGTVRFAHDEATREEAVQSLEVVDHAIRIGLARHGLALLVRYEPQLGCDRKLVTERCVRDSFGVGG